MSAQIRRILLSTSREIERLNRVIEEQEMVIQAQSKICDELEAEVEQLLKEKTVSEWRQYKRTDLSEMRHYVPGEDLTGISVSEGDDPPTDKGVIARDPFNHKDQWYVSKDYFERHFEAA